MATTETPRAERFVKILTYLIRNRTRCYTARQICDYLNRDEPVILRNVQRDLQRLVDMRNVSHVTSGKHRGRVYYRLEPDVRGKFTLPIERNGLLAFIMLKRLQPLFAPAAQSVAEMGQALDKMVEDTESDLFEDLDQRLEGATHILGEQSLLAMNGETLDALLTALVQRQSLTITYQNDPSRPPAERTIRPVKLVLSNGELYFVCISERHADRDYYIKLCRITHAALTGKGFTVPAGRMKRINDRLTSSFGILDEDVPRPRKVVLAFPSYFELLLREKRYHHTQRITTAEDGSTVLTMTVPVDYELIKWVLSWMDDVTVVRPKALRDEIKGIADRLTWKYS